MKIQSTRFGELEADERDIIRFEHGLPGFPGEKAFVLLAGGDGPFSFLQSVGDADLTFILVDPFAFFADYEFEIDDAVAAGLGLSDDNPPSVFNIATLKGDVKDMTVNLLAPVLINRRDGKGVQLVLEKSPYSVRQPLFAGRECQADGQAAQGGR